MQTTIRHEMRVVNSKPEVWTCLDDVLDWLAELSEDSETPIEAGAALKIREILRESVAQAERV